MPSSIWDKEDFVGRAALLEADRRTLLYGLKCQAATPAMNGPVLDEDRVVGRVTAGAWSALSSLRHRNSEIPPSPANGPVELCP